MKKQIICLATGIALLTMTGVAKASLTTIGTAIYDSNEDGIIQQDENYNLIWDDDNNGNSVVWLDYTTVAPVPGQLDWINALDDATLSINLYPGYSVTWDDDAWRLPSAGTIPDNYWGGYGNTTSELGHLYYVELGFQSYRDRGNQIVTTAELNATNFDNLDNYIYWSGTDFAPYPSDGWYFGMGSGFQGYDPKDSYFYNGMAIRSGQVSAVPVPGAIWLLGSGLAGLVGLRKKKK